MTPLWMSKRRMLNAQEIVEDHAISAPAAHFMLVQAAFANAEQSTGLIERFYDLGGYSIRLCFAGAALIPHLTPALAHRATSPTKAPDLTICLWDTASTGSAMPPPAWGGDAYGARGEIIGFNDDRNQTNFQLDGPGLRVAAANLLDHRWDTALYWIPDATEFPFHERSAPLRMILNWWMSRRGRQVIHAGAVGTAQGGVLLAGKGGSGKSTVALACLQSKFLYASDDYLLLSGDPSPFAHSLYSSAKLHGDQIHRLPHLLTVVSNKERPAEEKAVLFLNDYCPQKLTAGFPIRAILLPRVTGLKETRFKRAYGAASLTALAPSTIFQTAGAGAPALQQLAWLVRQVPSYVLEIGTDIPRIPAVVKQLLSELI
jgi:hypothetical protein